MTFPSSWEWKIIPTDEIHHFSEGLVVQPPTRAKMGMNHPANLRISP
jgi:hypothetical protein